MIFNKDKDQFFDMIELHAKVSLLGAIKVFMSPLYVLLAGFGTLFFGSIVIWSLNVSFTHYILFELTVSLRVRLETIFWDPFFSIFSTYDSAQAMSITVFSVLSGINIALLVYVLKNKSFRDIPKKSGFGGTVFAVLAGGCAACGTSLLAPLIAPLAALFGVASGAFIRELTVVLNWLASLLIIYSIYKLGLLASTIQSESLLNNKNSR